MNSDELIVRAKRARENAYAPYSKFKVGAALLSMGGNLYTGANIENSSYSLTCCAERIAIFKAISAGETSFTKMTVIADTEDPVSPCGACRQVMAEFFDENTIIYLTNLRGEINKTSIAQLLPNSFLLEK